MTNGISALAVAASIVLGMTMGSDAHAATKLNPQTHAAFFSDEMKQTTRIDP